ncbi:hypothetical protein GCM10022198_13860 [Klugiella xanthotipulae]
MTTVTANAAGGWEVSLTDTPALSITSSTDAFSFAVTSPAGATVELAENRGLYSHHLMPTRGTDTLRLTANGSGLSSDTAFTLAARYTSPDGTRVGAAVTSDYLP